MRRRETGRTSSRPCAADGRHGLQFGLQFITVRAGSPESAHTG